MLANGDETRNQILSADSESSSRLLALNSCVIGKETLFGTMVGCDKTPCFFFVRAGGHGKRPAGNIVLLI